MPLNGSDMNPGYGCEALTVSEGLVTVGSAVGMTL